MSSSNEAARPPAFKWGKKSVKTMNTQLYKSFTYDGIEYFLYDCVTLQAEGDPEPYIGKLVKIMENEQTGKKRVKVVWFFRPSEITRYLENEDVPNNEIFLACGAGEGVYNFNDLETINGKCNVVCVSKDERNRQPSLEEMNNADYVFGRTFDVKKLQISDKFDDVIAGTEVRDFFNHKKGKHLTDVLKLEATPTNDRKSSSLSRPHSMQADFGVGKNRKASYSAGPEAKRLKKELSQEKGIKTDYLEVKVAEKSIEKGIIKTESSVVKVAEKSIEKGIIKTESSVAKVAEKSIEKGIIKTESSVVKVAEKSIEKGIIKTESSVVKVAEKSIEKGIVKTDFSVVKVAEKSIDKSRWFKEAPWEERLRVAYLNKTLVLFDNLDPSYASDEVKDIVRQAFQVDCSVKVIPINAISSPHSGQAFAIFKSKEVADMVINKLHDRCLMLDNERPLVACSGSPTLGKQIKFHGHLSIVKVKQRESEMGKAVSTSHFPQPNTIEYGMAVEWIKQHTQSELYWFALYKQHEKELDAVRSKLNQKRNLCYNARL